MLHACVSAIPRTRDMFRCHHFHYFGSFTIPPFLPVSTLTGLSAAKSCFPKRSASISSVKLPAVENVSGLKSLAFPSFLHYDSSSFLSLLKVCQHKAYIPSSRNTPLLYSTPLVLYLICTLYKTVEEYG